MVRPKQWIPSRNFSMHLESPQPLSKQFGDSLLSLWCVLRHINFNVSKSLKPIKYRIALMDKNWKTSAPTHFLMLKFSLSSLERWSPFISKWPVPLCYFGSRFMICVEIPTVCFSFIWTLQLWLGPFCFITSYWALDRAGNQERS